MVTLSLVSGETLWSQPPGFDRNTSDLSSLLQLPDVDADGAPDLLLLAQEDKEVHSPRSLWPTPRPLVRFCFLGSTQV